MLFKSSCPLFVLTSATLLSSGTAFAQSEQRPESVSPDCAFHSDTTSVRALELYEPPRGSAQSIRKLVKKMLIRRTAYDICDKGTGRCK
jgi:hypothetical protein